MQSDFILLDEEGVSSREGTYWEGILGDKSIGVKLRTRCFFQHYNWYSFSPPYKFQLFFSSIYFLFLVLNLFLSYASCHLGFFCLYLQIHRVANINLVYNWRLMLATSLMTCCQHSNWVNSQIAVYIVFNCNHGLQLLFCESYDLATLLLHSSFILVNVFCFIF